MKSGTKGRVGVMSLLCAGMLMGAASLATAQTTDTPAVQASEVGHATRTWLDLQSSNREAAPAQPMLGAEAGLAYRRYMESFKNKIPDLYGSMLSGSGGGGGGSSGGSGSMPGGSGAGAGAY
ncbi:hypothetical protein P3T18_003663 [Paraburkholderia sp. GAS199]|uniref:DUF3613 domain-containing protein n=1 Tax=Paraburkholderia sp. GAS199 TaxID=3035126 RepID=UPI003D1ACE35